MHAACTAPFDGNWRRGRWNRRPAPMTRLLGPAEHHYGPDRLRLSLRCEPAHRRGRCPARRTTGSTSATPCRPLRDAAGHAAPFVIEPGFPPGYTLSAVPGPINCPAPGTAPRFNGRRFKRPGRHAGAMPSHCAGIFLTDRLWFTTSSRSSAISLHRYGRLSGTSAAWRSEGEANLKSLRAAWFSSPPTTRPITCRGAGRGPRKGPHRRRCGSAASRPDLAGGQ